MLENKDTRRDKLKIKSGFVVLRLPKYLNNTIVH
jgi:hypothetical protein